MDTVRALIARSSPSARGPTIDVLWYFEEREDVGDWWRRHGWQVTVTPSDELMTGYGRNLRRRSRTTSRRICSSPRSEILCDSTQLIVCCLIRLCGFSGLPAVRV